MSTRIDPPIEIKIPPNDLPLRFESLEQIQEWAEKQDAPWRGALGEKPPNQHVRIPLLVSALQAQLNVPAKIKSLVSEAKATDDETSLAGVRGKLEVQLNNYVARKCLLSESREAKHVLKLFAQDKQLALSTLMFFQGGQLNLESRDILQQSSALFPGFFEASIFQRGLTADVHVEREGLNEVHKEFKSGLADTRKELASIEDDHAELSGRLTALHDHQKGEFENQIEASAKKMDSLEKLYREGLRLRAPVQYWMSKRKAHLVVSILFGGVFVSLVATMLYGFIGSIGDITTFLETIAVHLKDGKGLTTTGIFFLAAIPTFLILWVLRLVSRIFLNNLALHSDASERVAMTNTFLALMEEPEKVSEEDRILILQALFRPTAANTSQDEGAPPHWFDLLLSRIEPKKH